MYYDTQSIRVSIFNITTMQIDAHGNVVVTSNQKSDTKTFYVKGNSVLFDNAIVQQYQFNKNVLTITSQFPEYYYTHVQSFSLSEEDYIRVKEFLDCYLLGGC